MIGDDTTPAEKEPTSGLGAGLRPRVLSGLAWKGLSLGLAYATQFVVVIVLAHLLTPREFGLAGMVMVFSSLVARVPDLGLGAALVQRKHLDDDDRSTAFWVSSGVGAALTLVCVAIAPAVAHFYGEPEVKALFAVFSIAFVLEGIATTQGSLLMREMNFRSLEVRMMAATLVGAAVGITVAVAGGGAWAIVLQSLTSTAVGALLLWFFSTWRPRFSFSRASARKLGRFGANVFGSRLLLLVRGNVDNLLVGRYLGAAALGAYALAYNMMLIPLNRLGTPIQDVFYPAIAQLRDRERIALAWLRANKLIVVFAAPAMLGLLVVAPDFVRVLFGPQWDRAVPVLQILTYVGLLQALQLLNMTVLQSVDHTHVLLHYWVTVSVASLVAFIVGLHWGIVGVAAAYAVSSSVMEPYYAYVTGKPVGVSLWTFARNVGPLVLAAAVMAVAVLVVRWELVQAEVSPAVRLLVCVLTGVAVYIPLSTLAEPMVRSELRGLRARLRFALSTR
jgi:O-antigen/teichoic acid export membrane protein